MSEREDGYVPLLVYVPPELAERVKKRAKRLGLGISAFIRMQLLKVLEEGES